MAQPSNLLTANCPARASNFVLQDVPEREYSLPDELAKHPELTVLKPLLFPGLIKLQTGITRLAGAQASLPFDPKNIVSLVFALLPPRLLTILLPTLTLEVNVARLQGRLTGTTGADRYRTFLQQLEIPSNLAALFEEYPLLKGQLELAINQWVDSSLEFLERLCQDWEKVQLTFSTHFDPGHLVALTGEVADSHRGARQILILEFTGGLKLVYKPKALALDLHFQELLAWLNERSDFLPFRTLQLIDRGSYGWVEFIEAAECLTKTEVARFYRRQGGLLALLYALEGTDIHYENLVAEGEHPVLIDLEALFHPRMGEIPKNLAWDPALKALFNSVLRVGLLPGRSVAGQTLAGFDLNGLAGPAGGFSARPFPVLVGEGTDEMRVARRPIKIVGGANLPTIKGQKVELIDYLDNLVEGFKNIYTLLIELREALIDGPLQTFCHDTGRFIARPTYIYHKLRQQSYHPNLLRYKAARNLLFDHLSDAVARQPHLGRLVSAEKADLEVGDIPVFNTRLDSTDLFTSQGDVIGHFFEQAGLTEATRRLRQLNDQDLEQQIRLIRTSIIMTGAVNPGTQWQDTQLIPAFDESLPTRLKQAAIKVGDRLVETAHWQGDKVNWIGFNMAGAGEWRLGALRSDLYNGTSGIALFLAYLGYATGDPKYTRLAKAAVETIYQQVNLEIEQNRRVSIGVFNGLGGPVYLFSHLVTLWNDRSLLKQAEKWAEIIAGQVDFDTFFDIIGGSAGSILSLLSLYRVSPSPALLKTALACGNRLLTQKWFWEGGLNRMGQANNPEMLAGFSHGAAGIALSLLRLAGVSGEPRFREFARAAILYERGLFSPEKLNWPDLRNRERYEKEAGQASLSHHNFHYMVSWCHGAPGIGLARLAGLPFYSDNTVVKEIRLAFLTTLAEGFGFNHSLCHGDLGNLEFLLAASQNLAEKGYSTVLQQYIAIILDKIEDEGWFCGIPHGLETPGLMSGLAGIGYQLLRLSSPAKIPSVLVLSEPILPPDSN
jgi:type 2 lantibiotic biosynthesis protein LanM